MSLTRRRLALGQPLRHRLSVTGLVLVALTAVGCGSADPPVAEVDAEPAAAAESVAPPTPEPLVEPGDTAAEATGPTEQAADAPRPCVGDGADFSGQDLAQPGFTDEDLRCADFSDSALAQPRFVDSDLDGASFVDAELAQARFEGVTAIGADLTGATLTQSEFVDSDLTGAVFTDAVLVDVEWNRTTCPNGLSSDELGGTCEGGLDPIDVETGASEPDAVAPVDSSEGPVDRCVGLATGTYAGDDLGAFVVDIGADGVLSAAFVSLDGVDLGAGAEAAVALLGLEPGVDVSIVDGEVLIAASALERRPGGVSIGTLSVDLDEVGVISVDGAVVAVNQVGAVTTGSIDLADCTGSGEWANGDLTGTWRIVPPAS